MYNRTFCQGTDRRGRSAFLVFVPKLFINLREWVIHYSTSYNDIHYMTLKDEQTLIVVINLLNSFGLLNSVGLIVVIKIVGC